MLCAGILERGFLKLDIVVLEGLVCLLIQLLENLLTRDLDLVVLRVSDFRIPHQEDVLVDIAVQIFNELLRNFIR